MRVGVVKLALIVTLVSLAACTAQAAKQGDLNGDGNVTSVDALMALKMSVGSLEQDMLADLDGDEEVTANDALLILRMAADRSQSADTDPKLPPAAFTARPGEGPAPLNVTLEAQVPRTLAFSQAAYTFQWDFGDRSNGTGQTTSHVYTAPGTYEVRLTVKARDGGANSTTGKVMVTAGNSTAVFGKNLTGTVTATVTPRPTIAAGTRTPTPTPTPTASPAIGRITPTPTPVKPGTLSGSK